ncbi:FUSC family protein [Sphaerisporangium fuscum]|uniref:FUSC family protein n=1 Tax=Sphaerisporangium fuscum TaxID=2835868 RepID=UPI001BDC272C|nr:FUSC family protein [Sphaerisporangium fuscum]
MNVFGLFRRPAHRLADAAPGWLVETVRPVPARPDRAAMLRVAASITGPLLAGLAAGGITLGLLPSMGAMAAALADRGGSYRTRVLRMGAAGLGGATGFVIGHSFYGAGWWGVVVVVLVSVLSALVSTGGAVGSLYGLQLLVMTVIGIGVPFRESPPAGALAVLIGALWAVVLPLAGWPLRPRGAEEDAVAAVYRELARVIERPPRPGQAEMPDAALKQGYDTVLGARSSAMGPDSERTRLIALLNQASQIRNALISLAQEGRRPPPEVADAVRSVAEALLGEGRPARLLWCEAASPALRALRSSVEGAVELVTGGEITADQLPYERVGHAARLRAVWRRMTHGHMARLYTFRLALCMGVAAAVSELPWIQRSYWVMLTVALVLKPDFGSVFARALQRGLGTVVGALIGTAVLAVVPYGPMILIPIAIFAALLPYGLQRNWGLMSTFQAPLVVLLVDLLTGLGPKLAEIRLVDTLIGCAVVLLAGYLPWPASWHAHVGPTFADAVAATAGHLRHAFHPGCPRRALHERKAMDALADLRTVFQRAVTEPPVVSRRVTTWTPAMTALEQVADATAATVSRTGHGAPPPAEESVQAAVKALDGIADAVRTGQPVGEQPELPDDPALEGVVTAVRALCDTLSEKAAR